MKYVVTISYFFAIVFPCMTYAVGHQKILSY